MKVFNLTKKTAAGDVVWANSFPARLFGLLLTSPGERGIWLLPCNSVHTLGMRWPLDILFLDKELKVLKLMHKVKPLTFFASCAKAYSVLEFFSGKWDSSKIQLGDCLELKG